MAKDIATYIWEMAKADKLYDGLTLRQMFAKKVENDADEIRQKLRDLVAKKIQSERQPGRCELILGESIYGGSCLLGKHPAGDPKPENCMYVTEPANSGGVWYEVYNTESQCLIKFAIIPLQLKWFVSLGSSQITVSWKHWMEEMK